MRPDQRRANQVRQQLAPQPQQEAQRYLSPAAQAATQSGGNMNQRRQMPQQRQQMPPQRQQMPPQRQQPPPRQIAQPQPQRPPVAGVNPGATGNNVGNTGFPGPSQQPGGQPRDPGWGPNGNIAPGPRDPGWGPNGNIAPGPKPGQQNPVGPYPYNPGRGPNGQQPGQPRPPQDQFALPGNVQSGNMPTEAGYYWNGASGSYEQDPRLAALGITDAGRGWGTYTGAPYGGTAAGQLDASQFEGAQQNRQSYKDALQQQGLFDNFQKYRRQNDVRGAGNFDDAITGFGQQRVDRGRGGNNDNPYVTGYGNYDDTGPGGRGQAYGMNQFDPNAVWTGSYDPINQGGKPGPSPEHPGWSGGYPSPYNPGRGPNGQQPGQPPGGHQPPGHQEQPQDPMYYQPTPLGPQPGTPEGPPGTGGYGNYGPPPGQGGQQPPGQGGNGYNPQERNLMSVQAQNMQQQGGRPDFTQPPPGGQRAAAAGQNGNSQQGAAGGAQNSALQGAGVATNQGGRVIPDPQVLGLPNSPQFMQADQNLQNELNQTLLGLGIQLDTIPQVIQQMKSRFMTDQGLEESGINQGMSDRGILDSSITSRTAMETNIPRQRQWQDFTNQMNSEQGDLISQMQAAKNQYGLDYNQLVQDYASGLDPTDSALQGENQDYYETGDDYFEGDSPGGWTGNEKPKPKEPKPKPKEPPRRRGNKPPPKKATKNGKKTTTRRRGAKK